jgi:cyclic pyranopterin phosphate synthase
MDQQVTNTAKLSDKLIDPYGRTVDYLRVSVTDRCDLRCVYCMSENMTFLPRKDLLTLEELDRLCTVFVKKGVRRLRLTGGEPLVRRGIMDFITGFSRHLKSGALDELTLTTNGTQLAKYAKGLADAGVRRLNVSLDTLQADRFRSVTRWGDLAKVLSGIDAALDAGLQIKINMVAVKGFNVDEIVPMMTWCHRQGMDLTMIETMPLGDVGEDRNEQFISVSEIADMLKEEFTLNEIAYKTGGPARYVKVEETAGRLGFITPMTHNFCESCNRVRLTCTGVLYMCLGKDDAADLRAPLRQSRDNGLVTAAVEEAITRKPKGHDFLIDRDNTGPAVTRHMSTTGG